MREILIVSNFAILPNEGKVDRFFYLKKLLEEKGEKVRILISTYSHIQKKNRNNNLKKDKEIQLIEEPGYLKNISIKRFYSHFIFGLNVKKYLEKNKKNIKVIYCAVPSLTAAYYCAKFCKRNNIKFIIDIQDLWPESFKMIFNPKYFSKLIYFPFEKIANYIYLAADEIVAVSETYIKRAIKVNKRLKKRMAIYLGIELKKFDELKSFKSEYKKAKDKFIITYLGTLGWSYDIKLVIDALKILKEKKDIKNIQFLVLGDGPLEVEFKEYALKNKIDAIFLGRKNYNEIPSILNKSDIFINPIKKNSAASIINKVGDYAAAGKAVVNTQESLEYRKLLNKYNAGINCNNFNEVAEAIFKLYENENLRKIMGENNRKLAEDLFDRSKTHKKIIELICEEKDNE